MNFLPDRRKFKRKLFGTTAHLALHNYPLQAVRLFELGMDGAGIIAAINPAAGLEGSLRFSVPVLPYGSQTVTVSARVMRCVLRGPAGGFVIALQFTDVPPVEQACIRQFVDF